MNAHELYADACLLARAAAACPKPLRLTLERTAEDMRHAAYNAGTEAGMDPFTFCPARCPVPDVPLVREA